MSVYLFIYLVVLKDAFDFFTYISNAFYTAHFYILEGQRDALLCGNSSDAG